MGYQRFVRRAEGGCRRERAGTSPLFAGGQRDTHREVPDTVPSVPEGAQRSCLEQLVSGKEPFEHHE